MQSSKLALAFLALTSLCSTAFADGRVVMRQTFNKTNLSGNKSLGDSTRIVTKLNENVSRDENSWKLGNRVLGVEEKVVVETRLTKSDSRVLVQEKSIENRRSLNLFGLSVPIGKAVPEKQLRLVNDQK